jgi:hypothetical protein
MYMLDAFVAIQAFGFCISKHMYMYAVRFDVAAIS